MLRAMASGDLSITALYTSGVWAWGRLPDAELFATRDAERVFAATNAVLAVAAMVRRDLPPLRDSLLHRHAMIDHLAAGSTDVLELASGLSRRGATLSRDPSVRYVELDLPAMVAKKRELLERTPAGRAVLARSNFELVAGDVATAELAPLVRGKPPLVIAEGLAMYLTGDQRRALFAKVAALGELRFVFDLVPEAEQPRPGRVGRALEAVMKRFTGGRSFERDAQTRDQILTELRAAGFADVRAIASREVVTGWRLPRGEVATTMVVFEAATARATRS